MRHQANAILSVSKGGTSPLVQQGQVVLGLRSSGPLSTSDESVLVLLVSTAHALFCQDNR